MPGAAHHSLPALGRSWQIAWHVANGGQLVTYEDSDGTGVANGQYLAIRFNNFPTAGQTTPDTSFAFTMSTPATDTPEPSSVLLLMSGLAGLAFMKRKAFQS